MIKNQLPIKYKLILVFGLLSAMILFGYFLLAVKLFEQDKLAYVYSSALESVENKRVFITDFINYNLEKLDDTDNMLAAGREDVAREFLNHHSEIKYYKSNSRNFEWGDQALEPITLKEGGEEFKFNFKREMLIISRVKNGRLSYKAIVDIKSLLVTDNVSKAFYLSSSESTKGHDKKLEQSFRNTIYSARLQSGVKELEGDAGFYLVAYNKISSDTYFINAIHKDVALVGVNELKLKSMLYLLGLVALASIFSILMANYFTTPIEELIESATLFGNGNFLVRAKIFHNNELGKLSSVFNTMAEKISTLIAEVESYSKHLEELVAEKTASLKRALSLQKAMINSLDQGFFLVNEKQKILGEFSNSAKLFFGPDLEGKPIDAVIKGEGIDPQFLKTFFENLFLETIPFESLLELAPKQFNTIDHRTIVLDYEPIRNSSDKIVVVVVISTDITEKLKIEKENERQRSHVKMILKILNAQYQFTRLLQETKASFDEFSKHEDANLNHEHLLRLAHSLKGNFGIYFLIDLVHLIHEIEKKIILAKDPLELMECFHNLVSTVDSELTALALEYPFLTSGTDWKQTHTYFTYEESQIKDVIESVNKARNLIEVKEILNYQLLKLPIKTLLVSLIDDCIEHADRVGKPMLQFDLYGGDLRVDPTFCSILAQHLIHLTRNSVDHGLEFPSERLSLGKKENGCISIIVSKPNEEHVVISIKDDGRGINVERLSEKAKEAGIDMSRFNEENAWELIFEPGLSTAIEESLTSGRGIGMFDVQKFIRDSRGEIKVSTQKGVGTEFIITLPTF